LFILQLTELKAVNFEFDANMRKKITSMQKAHSDQIDSLQVSTTLTNYQVQVMYEMYLS
jgi:hypothetical protein